MEVYRRNGRVMSTRGLERVEKIVAEALTRFRIGPSDLLLIALSGGPDSVALTWALVAARKRLGYRLAAAHLNHNLRGAESDRDEAFVRDLCGRLRIAFHAGRVSLGTATSNLEERAREARYAFLDRIAGEIGARHIVVAHHADDQAETVIMRLIRGAGLNGLAAMAERGPGRLIRPMLSIRRIEIMRYLESIGASFVHDSSNLSADRIRNRIRAELIPAIEREYSPGLANRLAGIAREMGALSDFVTHEASAALNRVVNDDGRLDLERFTKLHPALRGAVMREYARRRMSSLRRISRIHVDALIGLASGKAGSAVLDLPGGWRARREYGRLEIVPWAADSVTTPVPFCYRIIPDEQTEVPGFTLEAAIIAATGDETERLTGGNLEALFDADRVEGDLEIRSFQQGDRIRPLGMNGSRKVKQVFIDRKIAQPARLNHPVVTIGGEIAWVPGVMRARIALLDAKTRRILRLRATPAVSP